MVEDIFVAKGEIELLLTGEWTRYGEGDAVRFAADQPHSYRNPTKQPAQFHNTLHYARTRAPL